VAEAPLRALIAVVIMASWSFHRRYFHDRVNLFAYTVNRSTR